MEDFGASCLMVLIIPVIVLVVVNLFKKYPPKERNSLYGYRTSRSRKSQKSWDFAQEYAAELLVKTGWYSAGAAVLSCVLMYFLPVSTRLIVGFFMMLAEVVALLASVLLVEKKLKEMED